MRNKIFQALYGLRKNLYWRVFRPKTLGVRVMMIKDDEVLLVYHSYQNMWFMPGGGINKGETADQAVRREIGEEIGGRAGKLELFGLYTNFTEYKNDHIAVFLTRDFTVDLDHRSVEIEKINFFPLNNLPENLAGGHRRRIEEYKRGKQGTFGKL